MDAVLDLNPQQRAELFSATAQRTGIGAVVVEKDFWVCWTLRELFALPTIGDHLIFKGGTSLSKAFKLIRRFSEDIDVSIDRAFLGFGGTNEPEAGKSNKEKQRRVDALKLACRKKINNDLLPELESAIRAKVRSVESCSVKCDTSDSDGQTLLFEYPLTLSPTDAGYVRRAVKIEMGARADAWPSDVKSVTPYVAEQFPESFKEGSCRIKVLSAERTFWEKATILHAEFHRPPDKPMPARLSRHYYDLHEVIRAGVGTKAEARLDVLERVVEHKSLFFRSSWAKYDEAAKGQLRIAPPEFRIKALRDDYGKMREMFFDEPPVFEEMIAKLRDWEMKFNDAKR
jgi:predicted nucleotidyltransferase component of viral defense system